jgi:hypothetical protein
MKDWAFFSNFFKGEILGKVTVYKQADFLKSTQA